MTVARFAIYLMVVLAELAGSRAIAQQLVPARFEHGLVYVDLPAEGGRVLRMYTDSGGGALILSPSTASALGLPSDPAGANMSRELGPGTRQLTRTPRLVDPRLPPLPSTGVVAALPAPWHAADNDGFLGNNWFGGRVWTWDYAAGTLRVEAPNWAPPSGASVMPVTFRKNEDGTRVNDFPRMTVRIDGKDLPMLFDTGALTVLTPAAVSQLADGGPARRATSMVTASTIAAWRRRHPDWRVIEAAQVLTGSRMIEVPQVEIGGVVTGPVWFTERPDRNFRTGMSAMMAGPVEGAIGGNAFAGLQVTLDYPGARLVVTRAE